MATSADVLFYIIYSKRRCWAYCRYTLNNCFILKPKITLIRFHSLSFVLTVVVIRCTTVVTRCHSLPLVATRCITRCHSLYYSLSFIVFRCTTCYHLLSLLVICYQSLYHWLLLVATRCTTRLCFYKRSEKSAHLVQKSKFYQKTTNKQSRKFSKVKFWPMLNMWCSAYRKPLNFELLRNWIAF